MKNYTIKSQEEAKDYILDFEEVKKGEDVTYNIYFADGKKFGQVAATKENLEKIEQVQEQQAKKGIENKNVFKARKTKAGIAIFISAALSGITAFALTSAAVKFGLIDATGIALVAGRGIITSIGTIPAVVKFMEERAKVKEIEKIEYRDEHARLLGDTDNYANSLTGVSKQVVSLIADEERPFSILNVDSYSKKDLETIVDNIEREKRSGLQYVKSLKS